LRACSRELDHALVGRTLLRRVTGAAIRHVNADEARILDDNTEFNPPELYRPDAYRSSGHDPVLVGLLLR
jgi:Predicted extracellular nuclease